MGVLYWDTEALESKDDAETWIAYKEHAGIGLAVIYDEDEDAWEFYGPRDLERLASRLELADEVVSYNGVSYDHPVLDAALGRRIYIPNETDLWLAIREARRDAGDPQGSWKLDAVGRRTVGRGKLDQLGALAPSKLREGDWTHVVEYCLRDVQVLRDLYQFIRRYGYVIGPGGEQVMLGVREETQ